jgi:hypothetical protein
MNRTPEGNTVGGAARLQNYLRAVHPRPATGKEIALEIGLSYSYARRLLSEAKAAGTIRHVPGVGYALVGLAHEDIEVQLENLVAVAKCNIAQVRPTPRVSPTVRRHKGFGGVVRWETGWHGRLVHVQEFDNGTLHLQLGARGQGLSYLEFAAFLGWVEGLYPRVPLGLWHIKNWEWNHDFMNVRLEGATAITLQAFANAWFKLYQKVDRMRMEVRQRTDITAKEALDLIMTVADAFLRRGVMEVTP